MTWDLFAYSIGCMFMAVTLALSTVQLIKLSVEFVIRRRQDKIEQIPFGRRRG